MHARSMLRETPALPYAGMTRLGLSVRILLVVNGKVLRPFVEGKSVFL